MKLGDLVAVTWLDACVYESGRKKDRFKPVVVVTYGRVVIVTRKYVAVTAEELLGKDVDYHYRGITTITRAMIESYEILQPQHMMREE